jgi:hypothetical protein
MTKSFSSLFLLIKTGSSLASSPLTRDWLSLAQMIVLSNYGMSLKEPTLTLSLTIQPMWTQSNSTRMEQLSLQLLKTPRSRFGMWGLRDCSNITMLMMLQLTQSRSIQMDAICCQGHQIQLWRFGIWERAIFYTLFTVMKVPFKLWGIPLKEISLLQEDLTPLLWFGKQTLRTIKKMCQLRSQLQARKRAEDHPLKDTIIFHKQPERLKMTPSTIEERNQWWSKLSQAMLNIRKLNKLNK